MQARKLTTIAIGLMLLVPLLVQAGFKEFNQSPQQLLPQPINAQFSQQPTQALPKELHNQNKLMQYRAGNHIMGFSPEKVYVAGMGYSLIEEFVHANKVTPVSNQANNTQPLNTLNQQVPSLSKVNYPELYDGISLRYESNNQGIAESFWNQAKRHMRKFNGVPKDHFHLFLKECEWRFNNSDPKLQLKQLNQWVKGELG